MTKLISTVIPEVLYQLAFQSGVNDRATGQTIKTLADFKSMLVLNPSMDIEGAYRSYRNGFIRIPEKAAKPQQIKPPSVDRGHTGWSDEALTWLEDRGNE